MASHKVTASLQNDKGTWTVRGRVYDPVSGRMKQHTKTTGLKVKDNTKRQAQAMMKGIVDEWEKIGADLRANATLPFSVYVERCIERMTARHLKENSIKSYKDYANCHILPKLGAIPAGKLSLDVLERFYADYLKTHTVNSARKLHVVVNAAVQEAVKDGALAHNVASDVEFPKGQKFTGAGVYTAAEVNKLFTAAKEAGEPIRAAIILAVCYGLRRSEVLGLRWSDIDFDAGKLTVSNTVVQNGELRIECERTKTAKSHRTIALLPMTVDYLKELRAAQRTHRIKTDKVVSWDNGREVRPDYVYRTTQKLMEKCGLPVIRFHDLRHTAASLLAEQNIPPEQLRDFLGHESIGTTLDVYTHVLDKRKAETSAAMNEALKSVSIS